MIQKVKNGNSIICIFIIFLLIAVIASDVYKAIITPESQHIFKVDPDSTVSISPNKLNSSNVILIRLKDHAILMQKNSEEKIYPASLTKIMTAIVAIENLPDLNEEHFRGCTGQVHQWQVFGLVSRSGQWICYTE
jgi:D-alanyl-D-alanine carboxypeptidase (penicillin-binding protein 5/6)